MQNSILMWPFDLLAIPEGWALCDGTNGTPDLRNRFIVGAGNTFAVGNTGGSKDVTVIPQHTHTAVTNTAGGHTHLWQVMSAQSGGTTLGAGTTYQQSSGSTSSVGNHTHSITLADAGESGTDKNIPPYIALFYIMKL